jgi:predicted metalloprotease with PDZ domain
MKRIFLLSLLIVFLANAGTAQNIVYHLKMEKPESHYFQVDMELNNLKSNEVIVKLPVWTPGSYLVREFAKNLDMVHAKSEDGQDLKVEKISKSAWKISTNKAKNIVVSYEVYAFELSVRTSFLDFTHGFVSGSGVFMYTDAAKNKAGKLHVYPHSSFEKISTALPQNGEAEASDAKVSFSFNDYDHLVDSPLEIGNQTIFDFNSAGVKHTVAMYGRGNHDIAQLKEDMSRITKEATAVFGENPNKEYLFIIHNVERGQGGLEHKESTVLSCNRWTYQGAAYTGFLSLVAHEYFHLWNVKRIRPVELGPFNYDQENYTDLLWVMEGFTSYYDELLLLRAGYYSQEQYLAKLNNSMNYVEGTVGARIQPVAHASFDAWIKAYRPNENSSNTTMTYYTRGQMMAAIFDAMIVYEYQGEKCLDDFMQVLYKKYYKELGRGFTSKEFKKELSDFIKLDMSEFFNNHIDGTEIPDYKVFFSRVGVDVDYTGQVEASFGARFSDRNGKVIVNVVRRGSSAENAGLSVGDEIIAVDAIRVDTKDFNELLETLDIGDNLLLLLSRDNILYELTCSLTGYEQPSFKLSQMSQSTEKLLRDYWLR